VSILILISLAIGLSLAMTLAWAIQRATGMSSWIDTLWSFAVGAGGVAAALLDEGDQQRRMVILVLVILWSGRLGSHIGMRTRGGGEDPRYADLIKQWGTAAASRLFLFLQVQAAAAFVLVLAVYCAASNPAPFATGFDLLAMMIGAGALIGEAIADRQLARFRRSAQGKVGVCEIGLWAYSRHPNYFFEWLFWCAWPFFAISNQFPWGWLTLLAPIQMYLLLVYGSGIPPLEKHMLETRGERFRSLQRRVNAFFPGPRRSGVVKKRRTGQ
jgi:steroid 5-alpha reductase family enzyme